MTIGNHIIPKRIRFPALLVGVSSLLTASAPTKSFSHFEGTLLLRPVEVTNNRITNKYLNENTDIDSWLKLSNCAPSPVVELKNRTVLLTTSHCVDELRDARLAEKKDKESWLSNAFTIHEPESEKDLTYQITGKTFIPFSSFKPINQSPNQDAEQINALDLPNFNKQNIRYRLPAIDEQLEKNADVTFPFLVLTGRVQENSETNNYLVTQRTNAINICHGTSNSLAISPIIRGETLPVVWGLIWRFKPQVYKNSSDGNIKLCTGDDLPTQIFLTRTPNQQ